MSRASASASKDAFVKALGGGGAFGFAFMRRVVLSSPGVFEPDRDTLESRGVAADSSPSSWSSPNESLLFAKAFFFFFFGGQSLREGVDLLRCDQLK